MLISLYFDHIEVDVPYEMLVHGPLRYFPKEAEFGSRFNCSPLFKTFLNNPAYLTDDFMGEELTKVLNFNALYEFCLLLKFGLLGVFPETSLLKFNSKYFWPY